jgi:acetyl esterase/lipase
MLGNVASSVCGLLAAISDMAIDFVIEHRRLTPHNPYPTAFKDLEAAFDFFVDHLFPKQYPDVLVIDNVELMRDP